MNSQTYGNSLYSVKQKCSSRRVKFLIPLYMFISSPRSQLLVQPGDLTDAFASCQRRHFLQCQIGSRHKPLSWLLHLLYIFITSLFSSCPAPTHTQREKTHTHLHTNAPHKYVHTQRTVHTYRHTNCKIKYIYYVELEQVSNLCLK